MDDKIKVVAVCGNEARIYSTLKTGRKLLSVRQFAHKGNAILFAQEFEDNQRRKVAVEEHR